MDEDHCVSQSIRHSFPAMEGDIGTLDDKGNSFMKSSNTTGNVIVRQQILVT